MTPISHWPLARKPRRDDRFIVRPDRLSADGDAAATLTANIAGEPRRLRVLVPGALPSEVVEVVVTRVHRNDVETQAVALSEPHPQRVAPQCPHALDLARLPNPEAPGRPLPPSCGGCSLQHLALDAQDAAKEAQLAALLRLGPRLRPLISAPAAFAYRNKLELSCGPAVGTFEGDDAPSVASAPARPTALGLRPRGFRHEVVPLTGCAIMSPGASGLIPLLGRWFTERGLGATRRDGDGELLRTVTLRESASTGDLLVDLGTTDAATARLDGAWVAADVAAAAFAEAAVALGRAVGTEVTGVTWTRRLAARGQRTTLDTRTLFGRPTVIQRLAPTSATDGRDPRELELELGPRAFFQPNAAAAAHLYGLIADAATDGAAQVETALDLYCGVGGIALALAHRVPHVLGVELVPEAIDAARENARRSGLENVRFEAGDTAEVLTRRLADGAAATERSSVDVVVVDPPRAGLEGARDVVLQLGARRLVYVSCNPEALARDLPALSAGGYVLRWAQPLDQFPHTPHVEVVALLERHATPEPVEATPP